MNIAVMASVYGYGPDQIKPWMESLKSSGFKGKVFVIVYNHDGEELLQYLKDNGVFTFTSQLNGDTNMATQRFLQYQEILNSEYANDVDVVITTDIRDVVFQSDPGVWVKNNIQDYDLLATSEGVTFRHEDWGGEALETHFGKEMFLKFADRETICSGVIAGKKETMIKLFETVYELSFFSQDPGAFIDQIFYAIAIYEIYNDITKIVPATENWCANLGTLKAIPENMPSWSTGTRTGTASYERFRKNKTFVETMKCKVPVMKDDGLIYADNGLPFAIVHQYDRYQPWNTKILSRLKIDLPILNRPMMGTPYDKSKLDRLKVKFDGVEKISRNTSQCYQDLFVLAATNGKRNGTFLEIGAQDAQFCNNTYILEKLYDWKGISIDIDEVHKKSFEYFDRSNTNLVIQDALTIDYTKLLEDNNMPSHIDFLQLDIDPSEITFECLMKIPFDKYTFSVITYETDFFAKNNTNEEELIKIRKESREYIQSKGYVLLAGDVCVTNANEPFEDWYVHPSFVDLERLKPLMVGDFHDTAENLMLN